MRTIPRRWWRRTKPAPLTTKEEAQLNRDLREAVAAQEQIWAERLPTRADLDADRDAAAADTQHTLTLPDGGPVIVRADATLPYGMWAATLYADPAEPAYLSVGGVLVLTPAQAAAELADALAEGMPRAEAPEPTLTDDLLGPQPSGVVSVLGLMWREEPTPELLAGLHRMLAGLPNLGGTATTGTLPDPEDGPVPPLLHDQLTAEKYVPDSSTDPDNLNGPLR